MRARDIIGRKVVRVVHYRWHDPNRGWLCVVKSIELGGGVILYPDAIETEFEPVGDIRIAKPTRGQR